MFSKRRHFSISLVHWGTGPDPRGATNLAVNLEILVKEDILMFQLGNRLRQRGLNNKIK